MKEPLLWNTLSEAVEFLNYSSTEGWSERKILNAVLISSEGEKTCLQWVPVLGTKFGVYAISDANYLQSIADGEDGTGQEDSERIDVFGFEELNIGAFSLNKRQVQDIFMCGKTAIKVIKRLIDEVISDDLDFPYGDCDRRLVVEPDGTILFVECSMVRISYDALKLLVSRLKISDSKSTITAAAVSANNVGGRIFPEDQGKIKREELINKYRVQWPSVEADLNEGSRNGLHQARKERGYYDEQKSLQWARERGKLKETGPSGLSNLSMAGVPSRIVRGAK
ncbi:MAG: hypothetical protein HHJ12_04350 [Glaciimonas sp.]|nr:hypothetical protein [Glaciimonas sp.]